MNTYAAFLGHLPHISIAELAAVLPDFSLVRTIRHSVTLFRTSADLSEADLDEWGGIVLIAKEVKSEGTLNDVPGIMAKELEPAKKGKVTFSLRTINVPSPKLKQLYRQCKDELKKHDRSSRYVGNERQAAVTVLLHDAGLLNPKAGCELVILQDEDFFWVGRSVAAQNPHAYTKRDMAKPVRDTRAGLLPPKLAQIMLNLGAWAARSMEPADPKKDAKNKKKPEPLLVLDPFCGTGVIPMECLVRGWPILASDLSQKAVSGCEKNLEWTRKTFDVKKKDVPSDVWKQDATKKFDFLSTLKAWPTKEVDVVVTESHLGPALSERPTQKDAMKIRTEIDALEREFLENMAESLPGVPVVVTWPCWQLKTGPLFIERAYNDLAKLGYEAVLPPGIATDNAGRVSLLYRRPDQTVGREILVLKPLKKG